MLDAVNTFREEDTPEPARNIPVRILSLHTKSINENALLVDCKLTNTKSPLSFVSISFINGLDTYPDI